MAESTSTDEREEPGAPVAKDAIDPALIKLTRSRPKIGVITGVGVVFLCVLFLLRLDGDRTFGGEGEPRRVAVADIVAGKVDADRYVAVDAEPVRSHAIRAMRSKTSVGHRVVPVRGSGERLWLVLTGDGWEAPTIGDHAGRLRKLADLPFADAVAAYARAHPRPVFATAATVRAGFATNQVATVAGDQVTVAESDRVAFDVIDPGAARIVATRNERLRDAQAWTTALTAAGIAVGAPLPAAEGQPDQLRFDVTQPDAVAAVTASLERANLWAARVEPVTRHHETTWGALRSSTAAGFTVAGASGATLTIPDAQVDLIGLHVNRAIPDDAYALITGEHPKDYWYVLPITIALVLIGLVFAWALVRAIRRDVLPARAR